jgi:YVTN family beta-propeller protein
VIDTKTRTVTSTFQVGAGAYGVAITPDGKQAYVTTDSGFAVVDTNSGVVLTAAPLGEIPEQVAITPDGKYAYVTGGRGAPTVSVITTKTRAVTDTIALADGSWPIGIAICSVQHTRKH